MKPPLTHAGWLVASGSLLVGAMGRALALTEMYVMSGVGLSLVVVAVVMVARPLPPLEIERSVRPRRVHLGDRSRVDVTVSNTSGRSAPQLEITDPVAGTAGARLTMAPLPSGQHRRAGYALPTRRRGVLRVGPLEATRSDPFGLAARTVELAGTIELTVLPVVEPLTGAPAGQGTDQAVDGPSRARPGAVGGEDFASLRSYEVGDDLRRIHWASSARTGELLVRQDDPAWQGHLTVVLDARQDRFGAVEFETAVSAAASLLNWAADHGRRVRLLVTDGTDTGPTDARTSLDLLLERLAVVDLQPGGDLPMLAGTRRADAGDVVYLTGRLTGDDWLDLGRLHRDRATTQVIVCSDAAIAPSPASLAGSSGDRRRPVGIDVIRVTPGRPVAPPLTSRWGAPP